MYSFDFTKPWFLLLLGLIIPIYYWNKKSIADIPYIRKKIVFFLRIFVIIILVFALAGFRLKLPKDHISVLFVVDSSLSISPENKEWVQNYIRKQLRNKLSNDRAGIVLFGKNALQDEVLSKKIKNIRFSSVVSPQYTNIADALQLASAIFPEDNVKRIVLVSDGNENIGNAIELSYVLASRKIKVFSMAYPKKKCSEILISRIDAPSSVSENEPFSLKIEVESSKKSQGVIRISRNEKLFTREKVRLEKGKNLFTITEQLKETGNQRYRVAIETNDDNIPNNNVKELIVNIKGKPKILFLTSDLKQNDLLGKALLSQHIKVVAGGVESLPKDLSGLLGYQTLIFDNINGIYLSQTQMQMINNYVKDLGNGFIMIGGDKSFGAGGYYRTPVEEILPVDLDIRKMKSLPLVALVLCIDKSGSMGFGTNKGVKKINLAREAAIATVEVLKPKDKVGIIGFDYSSKWISAIQYARNKERIINNIATLRAGGGTSVYPALNSALEALKNTQAAIKHIIVLTDGRTEPGDFKRISKEIVKNKITLSTIGVGRDTDIPFLQKLAKMGKGRFYFTNEASYLPRIFLRETIFASRSTIVEEDFLPKTIFCPDFLKGVNLQNVPILKGYVATSPKDRAFLSMVTKKRDPLLAYWRIGLGKSIAFTSDDGLKWAKNWLEWGFYQKFWTQIVRWTISDSFNSNFSTNLEVKGGKGYIFTEAFDKEGKPINFLKLKARVVSPRGEAKEINLNQTSSGRYKGNFFVDSTGTYFVTVLEYLDNKVKKIESKPLSISYSQEYNTFSQNRYLLKKIASVTGGKNISPSYNVFKKAGLVAYTPRSAWKELLILALLIFPLDVALRRVYLPYEFKEKMKTYLNKLLKRKIDNKQILNYTSSIAYTLKQKKNIIEKERERQYKVDESVLVKLRKKPDILLDISKISEGEEKEKVEIKESTESQISNSKTLSRLKKIKKQIDNRHKFKNNK